MEQKPAPAAVTDGAETSDAILRFMESIGHRSEAEFYLALFRAESKESFANLVIGASVLHEGAEAVVLDLRFLRGLGLVPVVTLGLSSTGAASLDQAERLHRRLERAEVPSTVYPIDTPSLAATVTPAVRAGIIPIVAFTTGDPNDGVPRFDALGDLSVELKTRKLIFVSRQGALRLRQTNAELPLINLLTDYEALKRTLSPKRLFLLEQARRILVERATHRMFIAVTSPLVLMHELFTSRGAGTLIKRGSAIVRHRGFDGVDAPRLAALLEASFGRKLFAGFLTRSVESIYLEDSYRGAALVRATPLGGYLCKFAVEREAQGEGIGRDLWQEMVGDYPQLFWRARADNPILPFYQQECDGLSRGPEWHVFWRGMPAARIPDAIATALAQPVDFVARPTPE